MVSYSQQKSQWKTDVPNECDLAFEKHKHAGELVAEKVPDPESNPQGGDRPAVLSHPCKTSLPALSKLPLLSSKWFALVRSLNCILRFQGLVAT